MNTSTTKSPSDQVDQGTIFREMGVGVGFELPWQERQGEDLVGGQVYFLQESCLAIGEVVGPANLATKVKT